MPLILAGCVGCDVIVGGTAEGVVSIVGIWAGGALVDGATWVGKLVAMFVGAPVGEGA
jgi:hypothetical protein